MAGTPNRNEWAAGRHTHKAQGHPVCDISRCYSCHRQDQKVTCNLYCAGEGRPHRDTSLNMHASPTKNHAAPAVMHPCVVASTRMCAHCRAAPPQCKYVPTLMSKAVLHLC